MGPLFPGGSGSSGCNDATMQRRCGEGRQVSQIAGGLHLHSIWKVETQKIWHGSSPNKSLHQAAGNPEEVASVPGETF